MPTRWDELYANDVRFKRFILEVVDEDKVVTLPFSERRALLTQFDATAAASSQPRQENIQNFADGVFVLYRGKNGDPVGTAFAISPALMLTACHNVVHRSDDGSLVTEVTDLKVASSMDKATETTEISAVGQVREVEVYKYNVDVDWACLKLKDGSPSFPFAIPLAADDNDMPKAATLEKMYIYHCPVQLFLEDADMVRCHVMVKEASVGIVAAKTINFQNGAFPGSCGGPYVFRNKAIALHVDFVSATKAAQNLKDEMTETQSGKRRRLTAAEITRKMVDSCVSTHTSRGTGIILHVRSGIRNLLTEAQER